MPSKTTQHHCPQCLEIAKPRCHTKGHMVECKIHHVFYAAYGICVQCKGAARRAEKLQRLEKEQARRASQESTNDGVGQLKLKSKRSKKKDRKKEKRSRA